MKDSRRHFLKKSIALSSICSLGSTEVKSNTKNRHRSGFPDFCNESSGLKIKSIESYTGQNQTFVKVTADDGSTGFGQVAN